MNDKLKRLVEKETESQGPFCTCQCADWQVKYGSDSFLPVSVLTDTAKATGQKSDRKSGTVLYLSGWQTDTVYVVLVEIVLCELTFCQKLKDKW
jgi:hypothetical protein